MNTWPDGGMTPFRSEKDTNWEGAFSHSEFGTLAGKIRQASFPTDHQHHDWLPISWRGW